MKRPLLLLLFLLPLLLFLLKRKPPPVPVPLTTIIQTGPVKGALSTLFLLEQLNLSIDRPYIEDKEEGEERLLAAPIIKEAHLSFPEAGTLTIDYTLRTPLLSLIDLENGVLDQEGVCFPLLPYFTPKQLPELYLGLTAPPQWGERLASERFALALQLLSALEGRGLKRIDLSAWDAPSLGTRELVLILERGGRRVFVRLPTNDWEGGLKRYEKLESRLQRGEWIVDLRLERVGSVKPL